MPLANILSWSRIAATPVIMGLLALSLKDWPFAYILAAVLFALAEYTDLLDGYFARKQQTVSNLGIFLDLTADKLFTAGVLVMLIEQRILSAWLVAIILCREFLITGMRTYAASQNVVIPAGKWGKWKTAFTAVALTWLIVWADAVNPYGLLHGVYEWKLAGDFQPMRWFFEFAWPLTYWVIFITVYSGYLYIRDAAYLFQDNPKQPKPPVAASLNKKSKSA